MGNLPKNPANARNKNMLVVGGSGSGQYLVLAQTQPFTMSQFIHGHLPKRLYYKQIDKRDISQVQPMFICLLHIEGRQNRGEERRN